MLDLLPYAILIAGIAHALAAFAYFSKARYGIVWSVGWMLVTIAAAGSAPRYPGPAAAAMGVAVAAWTLWWLTMRPSNARQWVAENARLGRATMVGSQLTIDNVRNFAWAGKGRHEARWETRTYNLDHLDAADLYVSTWGNRHIAHLLISFTFTDARPLCFSIETRRERTERWSSLAGFFKAYELMIIPGDEEDHVRVRTNVRMEHVRLFRLDVDHATTRRLLEAYVRDMNELADRPKFYHTLWTNCTTEIARLVRTLGISTPLDWRLALTGHVPEYLYDHGALGRHLSFAILNARADVGPRARAARDDEPFPRAIRQDLYDPRIAEFASEQDVVPTLSLLSKAG